MISLLWLSVVIWPLSALAQPSDCTKGACRAAARHRATVVLVETTGTQSWKAAERRLFAEFRAMGLRIVLMPKRQARDRLLPTYARRFHALGAFQLLRRGDRGVVRIWLERDGLEPGGYRHIDVGLQGAEVVTAAVLPVVELVFTRRMGALVRQPLPDAPRVVDGTASALQPPVVARPPAQAASLSFGIGFSPRQVEAAPQLNAGFRTDVGPALSVIAELSLPLQNYQMSGMDGSALWALRVGGLATPARSERFAFRLGPTLGTALLSGEAPDSGRLAALVGWRMHFDVALSPAWALVAASDAAWTLPSLKYAPGARSQSRPLFQPLLGVGLGLEARW